MKTISLESEILALDVLLCEARLQISKEKLSAHKNNEIRDYTALNNKIDLLQIERNRYCSKLTMHRKRTESTASKHTLNCKRLIDQSKLDNKRK